MLEIRLGRVSLSESTFAWTAPAYIGIWACTSASFGMSEFLLCIYNSYDICGSSTNLDSWQLNQLRTMKVGGNASATEFFSKHGGSSLLSDSDTKKKYSGKVAELYKEELACRVKADTVRCVFDDSFSFYRD